MSIALALAALARLSAQQMVFAEADLKNVRLDYSQSVCVTADLQTVYLEFHVNSSDNYMSLQGLAGWPKDALRFENPIYFAGTYRSEEKTVVRVKARGAGYGHSFDLVFDIKGRDGAARDYNVKITEAGKEVPAHCTGMPSSRPLSSNLGLKS